MKSLYIYNLFPRLYKNSGHWIESLKDIKGMGFNSIYLNPLHYPGFSGSLYAPKEFYEYNPMFFTGDKPHEQQLQEFLDAAKLAGIEVYMDLIVNHTSIDCPLIKEHKDWYLLAEDGDVKRPGSWENGQWVTWGDLATLDLDNSPDRDNLWAYFLAVCQHYLKLGFSGFRCDAAYQVSTDFWGYLISNIKQEFPGTMFLAETLGCTPVQIQTLAVCGFDYIFNSSKWWNYNDSWALEQYALTRHIAPSISFPVSHDTTRLLEDVDNNEAAFLQRLYFSTVFSKGFMITTGFEYGFKKRINVVETTPDDWEDTGLDYTKKIKKIVTIKKNLEPLNEESPIEIVEQANWQNVFCFIKEWNHKRVLVVLNKDVDNPQPVTIDNLETILRTDALKDYSPEKRISGTIKKLETLLKPGEVKIIASEKHYNS
jgi:starch synthase (maltosyl-transferring)